jgi:hypothetical protein
MSTAPKREDASPRPAAGGNRCGAAHPAKRADAVNGEALAAADCQGYRLAQHADRLGLAGTKPADRHDGTSSDPRALPPHEPPPESMLAWQARVASP